MQESTEGPTGRAVAVQKPRGRREGEDIGWTSSFALLDKEPC
jgi:hypothetical protein